MAGRDIVINNPRRSAKSGTVTAIMTAYREPPPADERRPGGALHHEGTWVGGRLVIRPQHRYLDQVRSGGELLSLETFWSLDLKHPRLDLKIVNNTTRTVVLYQADLEVIRSVPRIRPVPAVCGGSIELDDSGFHITRPIAFFPEVSSRQGEDAVSRITLNFQLADPGSGAHLTGNYRWEGSAASTRVGFEAAGDHPLIQALTEAGVRPVVRREPDNRWQSGFRTALSWDTGTLSPHHVHMAGILEYLEKEPDGEVRHRSNRFRASIDLEVGPPISAGLHFSESYYAPKLSGWGENYSIAVPVSHALRSGEADRLLISLPAEVPSTHDFRVSLLWRGQRSGRIDCGAVNLETWAEAQQDQGIETELLQAEDSLGNPRAAESS